jgi:hypothetical protein
MGGVVTRSVAALAVAALLLAACRSAEPSTSSTSSTSPSSTVAASTTTTSTAPLGTEPDRAGPAVDRPDLVGAPPEVADREPLPYCGAYIESLTGEQAIDALTHDEDSFECFLARLGAGVPAEMVRVLYTVEGDAILSVYRITGDGTLVVFADTIRDDLGAQEWSRYACNRIDVATREPVDCTNPVTISG